jgi:cold shock protein
MMGADLDRRQDIAPTTSTHLSRNSRHRAALKNATRPVQTQTYGKGQSHAPQRHSKIFQSTRGFGFIVPENGEKDVFVHTSALAHSGISLKEGDKVSFETENDTRGRGVKAAKVALS